jgi:hypothetical protein
VKRELIPAWIYETLAVDSGFFASSLADISPNVMTCTGSFLGCLHCILLRVHIDGLPVACTVPCSANTANACGNAWGAFLSKYLTSKSVICTHLFKRGFIDTETFIADGMFGAKLTSDDPLVMQGYRMIAGPVVTAAEKSETVTRILNTLSMPWMDFMKYEQGFTSSSSFSCKVGWLMTEIAKPVFRLSSMFYDQMFMAINYLRNF